MGFRIKEIQEIIDASDDIIIEALEKRIEFLRKDEKELDEIIQITENLVQQLKTRERLRN